MTYTSQRHQIIIDLKAGETYCPPSEVDTDDDSDESNGEKGKGFCGRHVVSCKTVQQQTVLLESIVGTDGSRTVYKEATGRCQG